MSGIYTFLKKTLLYLLAFCVINMLQISFLIDLVRLEIYFCSHGIVEIRYLLLLINKEQLKDGKDCRKTFIIPIIIAIALILFFVILYIILLIIMWKIKYWNVTSRTKITMPHDLKKPYIIFKIYNSLLYIILHIIFLFDVIMFISGGISLVKHITIEKLFVYFCPLFILIFSSKIIKEELNYNICNFDPKLDKEYEYSNDLNDYDDYDDDNEEEEKDEKIFEKLKRHWKSFYDSFILHITDISE
ncbi:hypothetical protein RirG_038870 [Rhizophagus irregularis DAOM 197198w]|uniref:Uncharacterized protein n=1 Tax=Rhizophagus irregularis (strain DAOM 197198w) TaxID=1432141 RepID=A0A015LSZ9_RHIIW|nr:hypothetical protein RirG_038870 [Rhizophagus irregularis DAOM 197198w]